MRIGSIASAMIGLGIGLSFVGTGQAQPPDHGAYLQTFRSQRELDAAVERWRKAKEKNRSEMVFGSAMPPPALPPAAAPAPAAGNAVPLLAPGAASDGITNVQTQGVDEGDIVKRQGDYLIVLRRGRLFTVKVGGDALQSAARIDANAPGLDPDGTWYDEMLVSGDTVAVIGYSYRRRSTEVGLFKLHPDGRLEHRDTYFLRSNDYYDSRNFASRLIGTTLIFYTPLVYSPWDNRGLTYPAIARSDVADDARNYRRILPAQAIYRADQDMDPMEDSMTLHTVTRCDLARQPMQCSSVGVLGPDGRTFYVSRDAVYVWLNGRKEAPGRSLRIPLDGAPASALKVYGAPIDQMSFLEGDDGRLNVLVQSEGRGQGMWRGEWGAGKLALLRVPVRAFGGMNAEAPRNAYRFLPPVASGNRQNRYVGDWLLYGAAPYRWSGRPHDDNEGLAYAVNVKNPDAPIRTLSVGDDVERIEALGQDALLVGKAGQDLTFSFVALSPDNATLGNRFVLADARQGESRTHGFFYRADGPGEGLLGLPILRSGETASRPSQSNSGARGPAAVLFLRNHNRRLQPFGELDASPNRVIDDACKASCVDWYGNARPIFLGPRVLALMGYELVEGQIRRDRLVERRRIDFAPIRQPEP